MISTRLTTTAIVALLALFTPACRSMSDVVEAHQEGDGTAATYPADARRAFTLAAAVLRAEGADAVEQHPEGNYMLATFSADSVSYGTLVGVWIEPRGATSASVRVISKRVAAAGFVTLLSESTFHEELAARLAAAPSTASN
jgi:hypothetical protein